MKRMPVEQRKFKVSATLNDLVRDWTCRYGEWSRDKLLDELERQLRARRRERKAGV